LYDIYIKKFVNKKSAYFLYFSLTRSIARSDLDITYITSRLAVMPFPAEGLESAYRSNHIDDVRALLESRHPGMRALSWMTYFVKKARLMVSCSPLYPSLATFEPVDGFS
jgi:cyclin G-associated kinase